MKSDQTNQGNLKNQLGESKRFCKIRHLTMENFYNHFKSYVYHLDEFSYKGNIVKFTDYTQNTNNYV